MDTGTPLADGGQTMTQRLTELNEAQAAGLVSPEEYRTARAGIIGARRTPAPAIHEQPGAQGPGPQNVRFRLRLRTRDGRGLALEQHSVDSSGCRRAFMIRMGMPDEALVVEV